MTCSQVDQKTKDLLDEFTKKKRAKTKAPANEDGLDDKTRVNIFGKPY